MVIVGHKKKNVLVDLKVGPSFKPWSTLLLFEINILKPFALT